MSIIWFLAYTDHYIDDEVVGVCQKPYDGHFDYEFC